MGVVYQGTDTRDGTTVAIKTLRPELLVGSERAALLMRFQREAEIGARLRHPRIVQIRDYGDQDDVIFLAMEFVAGQELGKLLECQPELPLAMNLAILLQLLNALGYAHARGVIHRDVKPANILVRSDYTIALADFGIAHLGGSDLTHTGDLLGSPMYMAPEQLRGETVDGRADLFAAGVVFYYLLTRRKPFVADSLAALMHQVLHEEPPLPSVVNHALPTVFDSVLRRALAKDRRRRFASALEFASALRRARTEMAEAALGSTVVVSGPRRGRPSTTRSDHLSNPAALDELADRIGELLRDCINEQATPRRFHELSEGLVSWFARIEQLAGFPDSVAGQRERLRALCAGESFSALVDLIQRDAPLPGRVARQARGDWLELVRLFVRVQDVACRLDKGQQADQARAGLVREWAGAFLNYAGSLNRLLFSDDNPQLVRISADFMRLDLLQLALEELGAVAEVNQARQALLLFAGQVMSKVNAMIRQFLERRDPLARYEVASLLVEVEELIVLADRLLEGEAETTVAERVGPGRAAITEFVGNARELAGLIAQELSEQVDDRPPSGSGTKTADVGQTLFVGRLRQLGLLYRFVTHLEAEGQTALMRDLAGNVHTFLERLTEQLLRTLSALAVEEQAGGLAERLWVRLSIIAELAEQFGWLELLQRILIATRNRVVAAREAE